MAEGQPGGRRCTNAAVTPALWGFGRPRYTDGMPIDPPETVEADSKNVMCEGNGATTGGHPRVYLTMGAHDHVDCPYCDRRFVLKAGAKAKAGAH